MHLTDRTVRNAKLADKPYKLFDERSLYLLTTRSGKYWRFDYRFAGKRKTLALGVYPQVTLAEARQQRDDVRRLLAKGIDPSIHNPSRRKSASESEISFEAIARKWFAQHSPGWAANHATRIIRRLERDVFPWIGAMPISVIRSKEVLAVLRRIEARGAVETAHRANQNCGQVFRYAIALGAAELDPTYALRGALTPVKEQHHAAITDPKLVGALLRAIDGYSAQRTAVSVERALEQLKPISL